MIYLKEDFILNFKRNEDLLLFLHLLCKADDEGQITATIAEIAKWSNLTVQQVRTSLANNQNNKQLTINSTNKNTTITICDYDSYKSAKRAKQQASQQATNNQNNKRNKGVELTEEEVKEQRFQKRMIEVYPNVAKLKIPLTLKEYNKLLETYTNDEIKGVLLDMDNYKDLSKKYINTYLTLNKWLKLRRERT